jgi:hypothetical protein
MANTTVTPKKNLITQIIEFFKGNPILSVIASLAFLAMIMPPRKRKAKRKAARRIKRTRRKFSSNPGNPGKKKKRRSRKRSGKKIPRAVGTTTKTKSGKRIPRSAGSHRTMPAKFKDAKKGTALMAEKMNWLRSKR